MRPFIQLPRDPLPSASGLNELGLVCNRRLSPDPPPVSKCVLYTRYAAIFEGFDVRWPWPLTYSTQNWHSTYLCHGNVYTNFDFSKFFCCFRVTSPYGTDGQTDGRARCVIRLIIGRTLRSSLVIQSVFYSCVVVCDTCCVCRLWMIMVLFKSEC